MRWQRIVVATALTTIASWPSIATAPTDAPRPTRHIGTVAPTFEPIVAPTREGDVDGCASRDAAPGESELEEIVHARRDVLRLQLGPALTENLGGRLRDAVIAQGVAAPSFGWPAAHDLRFGVSTTMAIRALDEGDLRAAVSLATRATRSAPADPLGPIIGALASSELGDRDAQVVFLEEAHARAPDVPAITRVLAIALGNGPDLGRALRMCEASLLAYPDDARFAERCARLSARARTFAGGSRVIEGTTIVIAAAPVDARVGRVVAEAEASTATLVGATRHGTLAIYVYPDRASFDRGTCATDDDATFDGTLGVLASSIDTARGESRLRHHTAHAVLSTIAPRAPRWLSEGVAQIVAGPESAAERDALDPQQWVWGDEPAVGDLALRNYAQARAMTEWVTTQPGGIARRLRLQIDTALTIPHAFIASRPPATGETLFEASVFPDVVPVMMARRDGQRMQSELAILRTSTSTRVRTQAALALTLYGERSDVLETLERAMVHDESTDVRRACADALRRIGNPDAVRALDFVAENDEDPSVRDSAGEAIRALTAPSE